MKLSMHSDIFELWPEAGLGIVYLQGANNRAEMFGFGERQKTIEAEIKQKFPATDVVGQHPNIQAWRRAYRQFGCDPHEYRCSSEALTRQVVRGNSIWGINPLVDCYNSISLKYIVPVGGEDADQIVGEVVLRRARGDEAFVRLGGTVNEPPEPGEVIYADDAGVLCRRWNWREADRTKLTAETKNAILVIETIPPMTRDLLVAATSELAELVKEWCTTTTQTAILDQHHPAVRFS